MVHHRVYGLSVRSNLPVPGLEFQPPSSSADIQLEFLADAPLPEAAVDIPHRVSDERAESGIPSLTIHRSADSRQYRFDYADGTAFLVEDNGARVHAHWPASMTIEDCATYLLGPVLAFVLSLAGRLCLHASAIEIEGTAVALVGPSGVGKSTLAAAFVSRGQRAVAEDVLALRQEHGEHVVDPGPPLIRLWPSSVGALFGRDDALPLMTPNWEKRFQALSSGTTLVDGSRPLRLIYQLVRRAPSSRPRSLTLTPREAFTVVAANTYGNRSLPADRKEATFAALGALASGVPMRRLEFDDDFSGLSSVCDLVVADVAQLETVSHT